MCPKPISGNVVLSIFQSLNTTSFPALPINLGVAAKAKSQIPIPAVVLDKDLLLGRFFINFRCLETEINKFAVTLYIRKVLEVLIWIIVAHWEPRIFRRLHNMYLCICGFKFAATRSLHFQEIHMCMMHGYSGCRAGCATSDCTRL